MKASELMTKILLEKEREDKHFIRLEFNVREKAVVMNYLYEDDYDDDIHRHPHDADPEVLSTEEFGELKPLLVKEKVPYQERRDEFM